VDKRSLLAVGLCFVVFFLWTFVISPRIWPAPPPGKRPVPAVPAPAPAPAAAAQGQATPPAPAVQAVEHPAQPDVVLDAQHLRATFTNRGGGLKELVLKYPPGKNELRLLADRAPTPPHLALHDVGGPDAIQVLNWEQTAKSADSVEYRYRLRSGVEITKLFRMLPDQHKVTLTVRLENKNAPPDGAKEPAPVPVKLELLAFSALEHDSEYRYDAYVAGVVYNEGKVTAHLLPAIEQAEKDRKAAADKSDEAGVKKADETLRQGGPHKLWFGLKNRFFTVLCMPDSLANGKTESYGWSFVPGAASGAPLEKLKNLSASARTDVLAIGAAPYVLSWEAFAGPVKRDVLKEVAGAEKVLNYGGCGPLVPLVEFVAPMILGLLKFFGLLGNMGLAIILTTILIRLVLFPLSKKSQESAFRMQELGPKIAVLRERYKDDNQKFGMEQMKLYREHKINPLSGCLPLLFQLPIFIGMYSVFEMSIELRDAPFMLWMRDLSQPDHLLGPWKPIQIPLLITTLSIDALNLLPILMTVVWFLQAYWAPRSPDPNMASQQKMMMIMPVVFGLMCYNLASGLSLYFLVNSALSMGEQKLIKKFFLKPKEPATGVAK
jgi:YidC/Oxa1 family membrane protein insertase